MLAAKASVDVSAKAHAVVTLGVAASGTIVPPKVRLACRCRKFLVYNVFQIKDFAIIASTFIAGDLSRENL
jgi:hypothetical protein